VNRTTTTSTNTARPSAGRRAATLALSLAGAATLFACGGGEEVLVEPPAFTAKLQALPDTATEPEKHMQITRQIWADYPGLQDPVFCSTPGTSDPALSDFSVVPLTEIFDGFYYTGMPTVGQFVQKTPDGGFILYDTLYSPRTRGGVPVNDVQDITVPQLAAGGMQMSDLRAIVITHGHLDHDGGVAGLFAAAGKQVPVHIGSADLTPAKPYFSVAVPFDSSNLEPTVVDVGGLPITFLSAPGHTSGAVNFIVPVSFKGQTYQLAYWGGAGFPSSAAAAQNYLTATERTYAAVKKFGVVGSINSHAFFDHSADRINEIRALGGVRALSSNPMIQGNFKMLLSYQALHGCAGALLNSRDNTSRTPVWRPTTLEFFDSQLATTGNIRTLAVSARLSNYFNVISGGTVLFTTQGGDTCSATTNSQGVARCVISGTSAPGTVTAAYDGRAGTDVVDMDTTATRVVTQ
jgi:glyoxylase-like metal-dependent hydrolase (beta-lactamase superfamily II)